MGVMTRTRRAWISKARFHAGQPSVGASKRTVNSPALALSASRRYGDRNSTETGPYDRRSAAAARRIDKPAIRAATKRRSRRTVGGIPWGCVKLDGGCTFSQCARNYGAKECRSFPSLAALACCRPHTIPTPPSAGWSACPAPPRRAAIPRSWNLCGISSPIRRRVRWPRHCSATARSWANVCCARFLLSKRCSRPRPIAR